MGKPSYEELLKASQDYFNEEKANDDILAKEAGVKDSLMGTWTGMASGLAHDLPISFWEGVNMVTADHFDTPKKYIKTLKKEKADFNDKYLSEATKAQKRRQARILKDEDQNALDTIKGVFQNPAAVTNMAGESIPEMLAMAGTSGGTAVASKLIKPTITAMERLALASKTALGLNAFVNAADTFNSDELKDASTAKKYMGAGISGAGSYLANKAFDNATVGTLLKKALAPTFAGQSALKTSGKEFGQEFFEESANALGEQAPLGQFDLNEILKRGALGGTVGGLTAGGVHAATGLGKSRIDPNTPAREVSANRPLAWKGWEQAVTPKDQPPETKASEESTPQAPVPPQAETKAPEAQPVKAKEELPKPVEEVLAQLKQEVETTPTQETQAPVKDEAQATIETPTVVEPPQADTPEEQAEFERGYRVGMEQLNAARDSEEKTPENSQGVLAKAVNTALGQLETPNESAPQKTEAAQEVTKAVDQVIPQKEVQPSAVKNETPKLTLEQYVAQQGHSMHYDGQLDKVRMPHGETESQKRKRHKHEKAEIKAHGERLAELRQEYKDKVASGEIQKPSRFEILLSTAHGHPDNQSTHAARRVLTKRGYDWQTGEPLNKADKLDVPASETPTVEEVKPKKGKGRKELIGEGKDVGAAQTLPGTQRLVRLQNRDRNSAASIQQMTAIGAKPDYFRMSPGRDFGNGAPVVSFGSVSPQGVGKTDVAVMADGRRVNVRYAVVDANQVIPSHDSSGNVNHAYTSNDATHMRAIAGNGRIAGLQRAYELGNAAQYKTDLIADAQAHGVDPDYVKGLKSPVLVRIMDPKDIPDDVGTVSNTSTNMETSVVEQAVDDANLIDFSELDFDEEGNPTNDTVLQFVHRLPGSQQASLMESRGRVNQKAVARFQAALFQRTYENNQLTSLFAESTDPEAKNMFKTLITIAGKMVRLADGNQDLDLRPVYAEAAQIVINAKREGMTVAQYTSLGSLGQSADAALVARVMDLKKRSAKAMIEALGHAADQAFEAMSGQGFLEGFGEPKTRQQIMDDLRRENGLDEDDSLGDLENGWTEQSADTAERRTDTEDSGQASLLGDDERIERTGEPTLGRGIDGREQEGDPGSSGEDGIFKFSRKNGEQVDELHEKLKAVERDKVDIRDAFYREDIGSIDLLYGNKGFGIHHIISRRTEDGEIGSLGKERLLGILAYTIVNGKKTTSGRRIKLTHGASIVFLDKPKGKPWDNNFVLTGWARVIPKIKKSSGERRAAFLNSAPTSTIPTRRRYGGVAEDSANSLSEGDEKSIGRRGETTQRVIDELANNSKVSQIYKGLDNSRKVEIVATTQDLPESITSRLEHDDLSGNSIQAVYDSSSRKVYLISDNISEGTAEGVFLHEVGVHMAADQNYRKDMSALIARARQIVMNGKRNGDKTATRVYQRMVDAGLIDEDGKVDPANQDEFFAYLVEELANAKTDQGIIPAIKRWFTDVLAKVKTWLYDHGFISSNQLNQRDLLTIAKGNAEGLSKNLGERSGSGDVLIKKSVASDIGLKDAVKDKIDGGKRTLRDSVRKNLGGDWGSPLQKDELGKTKFAWGEHIVVGGTNVALDVAESFLPAVRSVRYLPKDMRKIIRRYAAQVDKAVQDSGEISTDMQAYSANDRKLISDVIEDMVKTGVNPPAHVVDMASKMSTLMDQQTDQLLELGMISRESAERYRGHYLPRFYRNPAKVDGKENIFTKLGIRKPLIEGIGGSHLKGRGCFKAVTAKEVKNFVELGWEVRDSRYKWDDAKQKLVSNGPDGQLFDDVYDEAVVGIWRDWTPDERQRMGEVRDAGFRFVMGWMSTQKDIALGRMFKAVSENPEYCSTYEQDGFVKVPETEITETGGVKRYGALAGKYVRKDILDYLSMHVEAPSAFAKVWKKALAYWKEGKTAHNPVSHMNNVMGNVIMSHLAGISMGNAKAYLGLIKDIVNKASWIKEAQESGLFSGMFSTEELYKTMAPELRELYNETQSTLERDIDKVYNIAFTYGLRDKLKTAYENEDKFFRLLVYKKARDSGLSPEDAVEYSQRFIPTYDDLPKGAQTIRDKFIPFFAWTYKTIPTIMVCAAKYPWRFAAPATLLFAANAISYSDAAGDDDDSVEERFKKGLQLAEAEHKLLPEYMQGRGAYGNKKFIRLWTDDTTGLPVYWNVSNFVPGGQVFDANNQSGGMAWPEVIAPSHPLFSMYSALYLNVDPFTGRDLVKDSDSTEEAVVKRSTYSWRQLAPALAVGGYHYERVMNAVANTLGTPVMGYTGIGRNGQAVTAQSAILNTLGIKVRDVDFEKEGVNRITKVLRENKEIAQEIKSTARLLNRGALTKESAEEKIQDQRDKLKKNAEKLADLQEAVTTRRALTKEK